MGFKDIGERLKLVRGTLLQEELASKMGTHKNTLARYERGESQPDSEYLNKLLNLYPDINPAWLLTGEGEMKRGGRAAPEMPAAPRAEDPRLAVLMEKLECIYKEGGFDEKARLRGTIEELYDEVCMEERKDMKGEKAA